jgi:hypothetical protein
MKRLIIALLLISPLFLAGCSISFEEKVGCERFNKPWRADCYWCEEKGGRYMDTGWSTECVFPNQ